MLEGVGMDDCGFVTEPKSRKDLRRIAKWFRSIFGFSETLHLPVAWILEMLSLLDLDFHFEIVGDKELPLGVYAWYDIISKTMQIRESVYLNAIIGDGRDRMTIMHETAHFILHTLFGFKLARSYGERRPVYYDPEWQAKCLAAEIMIDFDLVRGMSGSEIETACGVSSEAARVQAKVIDKECCSEKFDS